MNKNKERDATNLQLQLSNLCIVVATLFCLDVLPIS
jgi:hypothetical protein